MRHSGQFRRGLVYGFLALLSVTVPAALASMGGSEAAAAGPPLDHFECYSGAANPTPALPKPFAATPAKVLLKNKFAPGGFVVTPGAVQLHCNPAEKTVASVDTPISNPAAHLLCRAINPKRLKLPSLLTIKNQFGSGALRPTSARTLCMPSFQTTSTPVKFPVESAPADLDPYVCYNAANPKGTPAFKLPKSLKLKDQFGTVTTKVGAPNLLCLPTTATFNPAIGTPGLVHPDRYVVCFALPPAGTVGTRTVYDKNQFGIGGVKLTRNTELCVPSTKAAVQATTTTESTTTTSTVPAGIVTAYADARISAPYDIAAGSDGALWFTNFFGGAIGRISTDGVVDMYPDATIVHPDGIEAGRDGDLWFANLGNSSIGRINTGGLVSNYRDPRMSEPYRVGPGPGPLGVMWFTNSSANSVGFITTGGNVMTFNESNHIHFPQGIAAGSDGAMWFANYYGGSIGRVTAGGVVTSYPDPKISFPVSITGGPDGALWFTSPGNNSIGRITTAGVVTNFTDPSIQSPLDIVAGPDGAIWYTNYGGASIGRITTDGEVSYFSDPSMSYPDGIAAGSDGAIWFTNAGNNTIGRITT